VDGFHLTVPMAKPLHVRFPPAFHYWAVLKIIYFRHWDLSEM